MKVIEFNKKIKNTKPKAEVEEMLKKLRKEHDKLVKGKFEFVDAQGGWLEFTYRFFPDEQIKTFHFTHGEVCEIPMGIVKHLNGTKKKIRSMPPNITESGPVRGVPQGFETQSRIKFTPVDFM